MPAARMTVLTRALTAKLAGGSWRDLSAFFADIDFFDKPTAPSKLKSNSLLTGSGTTLFSCARIFCFLVFLGMLDDSAVLLL